MIVFVTLSVAIVGLLFYWFLHQFSYWKRKGFPFDKPNIPYGSYKDVGIKIHVLRRYQEFYEKYKETTKVIGLYFFARPILLIIDLDVVKDVMVNNSKNFIDRGNYSNKKDDPLSGNLINLEGNEWRAMRSKMVPAFTSAKIKATFDTYLTNADELIDYLKAQNLSELEVKNTFIRYMVDIVAKFAFGLEANAMTDPNSPFVKYGKKVFESTKFHFIKIMLMSAFPNLSRSFGLRELQRDISDFFLDSIKQTIKYRKKNNLKRNDFLNQMIHLLQREENKSITQEEVAAQSFVFFMGGYDTSSSTISFILYELALNPEIQERLREEIRETLSRHNNQLTYDSLHDMKYLLMCIDETLRKYPPFESLARRASQDYKIAGTNLTIKKSTIVMIPVFSIHHDEKIYPDPLKFDPERFSSENRKTRHSMTFLAFGEGPRTCIGTRFAYMILRTVLVKLLTTFRVSTTSKTTIPMDFKPNAMFLTPINDNIFLKLEML